MTRNREVVRTRGVDATGEPYVESRMVVPSQMLGGRHVSTYTGEVAAMKRAGDVAGATLLLERIVAQVWTGAPDVPPWFVEQLAIVYRLAGRTADEVALLERFAAVAGPSTRGAKLGARLARLRPLPG